MASQTTDPDDGGGGGGGNGSGGHTAPNCNCNSNKCSVVVVLPTPSSNKICCPQHIFQDSAHGEEDDDDEEDDDEDEDEDDEDDDEDDELVWAMKGQRVEGVTNGHGTSEEESSLSLCSTILSISSSADPLAPKTNRPICDPESGYFEEDLEDSSLKVGGVRVPCGWKRLVVQGVVSYLSPCYFQIF